MLVENACERQGCASSHSSATLAAMLLWFWSQSLQQAVAGLLSVHLSWMNLRPVMGIPEEMPGAGCSSGNNFALSGGGFYGVTNPSQQLPRAAVFLAVFLIRISQWDAELMLCFPPKGPLPKLTLLGEIPQSWEDWEAVL